MQFIQDNRKNPTGWNQIPNAIALAKACQSYAPELIASMLWKLNTLLKRAGNKRVVLEVANMSIAAASQAPRTEDQAKGEAVAPICGRAWVFQRVNRLEQARADGMSSLKLGENLGWDRNTAYCLKCVGRLYRMEAERAERGSDQFNGLVRSSIESLEQAILKFPIVSDHTIAERTAEVGDCYSLLGRTFLVAGDLKRATDTAREAINRITDQTSKDYADLQILLGDLAKVRGDRAAAEACYDEAIQVTGGDDAQKSEIAARAWFQKGVVTSASHCFNKAAEIWRALDEPENADRAEWESLRLAKRIPAGAIKVLGNESPSVRLEVFRQYEAQLAGLSGGHRGRRPSLIQIIGRA